MEKQKLEISLEQLKGAVKVDLDAAIYFLQALRLHPEILDKCTEMLHEAHTKSAALIDTVQNTKIES